MNNANCPICYETFGHAPGCPAGAIEEADEIDEDGDDDLELEDE